MTEEERKRYEYAINFLNAQEEPIADGKELEDEAKHQELLSESQLLLLRSLWGDPDPGL